MKKLTKLLLIILLALILSGGVAGFSLWSLTKPVNTDKQVLVEIPEGAYGKKVFDILQSEGVVRNSTVAYYYARLLLEPNFKAGKYEVNTSMTIDELVSYLSNGANALYDKVTVKFMEGGWLKNYASQLNEITGLSTEEILAQWNDETYLRTLMADYPFLSEDIINGDIRNALEGYLFPDTYEFFATSSLDEVTRKMLDRTMKVYENNLDLIKNSEFSIHELFTLASILQYEASNYEDMRNVASVFINRMEIGMMLQSSVTVCYALDLEPEDNWVQCETNNDYPSAYNTYLHYGLPPGPIVAPGEDALRAACNPADTDYLFFIGDVCGDGAVYFARNYDEHLALVRKYLWCY